MESVDYKQVKYMLTNIKKYRSEKLVLYPFGSEIGISTSIILERLFDIRDYFRVDNYLSEYNNRVMSLDDLLSKCTSSDMLFLICSNSYYFYESLKNYGIQDTNIISIGDTRQNLLENLLIYLIDFFGIKRFIDCDRYFENERMVSKQLFNSWSGQFVSLDDVSIQSQRKLNFPIYDCIYDKDASKLNTEEYYIYTNEIKDVKSLNDQINMHKTTKKSNKCILIFCDCKISKELLSDIDNLTIANFAYFNTILYEDI